jgi:RHS repeat-associated protein
VTGSRTLYYSYGEEGWSASGGTLPTDYGFTGQRREDFGLMDYNARYYDLYLNRFISPDTIIMVSLKYLPNPQISSSHKRLQVCDEFGIILDQVLVCQWIASDISSINRTVPQTTVDPRTINPQTLR